MVQTFFLSEIYIEISLMNRKVHDLEEMENTSHYHSIYIREMKMWHKYSPIWSTVFFIFILFFNKVRFSDGRDVYSHWGVSMFTSTEGWMDDLIPTKMKGWPLPRASSISIHVDPTLIFPISWLSSLHPSLSLQPNT